MTFTELYEAADREPYEGEKPLETLREELPAAVQKFLNVRNHGKNGCWPITTEDERLDFERLVRAIALVKWGADCDHSDPFTIEIREKRIFENIWINPIRRSLNDSKSLADQRKREQERLRAALSNVSSFMRIAEQTQRMLDELTQQEFRLKMARTIYVISSRGNSNNYVYFATIAEAEAYRVSSPVKYEAPKKIWVMPSDQTTEEEFLRDLAATFRSSQDCPVDSFTGYPNGLHFQYSDPQ